MSLQDFLAKSEKAAPKVFDRSQQGENSRISQIYMNIPDNQGFISFVPITAINGDELKYLYNVSQFQVYSTNEENGEIYWRWSKAYEKGDYVSELTPQQVDQLTAIRAHCHELAELGYESDWVREGKNYALVFGYVLRHVNVNGEVKLDSKSRRMALIVIPSKNFAKAITTVLQSISNAAAGEKVYNNLFSRDTTGRQYFLEMSCKQGSGFGYDITVALKTFDIISQDLLLDSEKSAGAVTIPAEEIAKCTNTSAIFAGNYNEDGQDWVPAFMDKTLEQIEAELKKAVVTESQAAELPKVPDLPPMSNE
jgi:hypothetical protein